MTGRIISAIFVATLNESIAFITLSLLLQLNVASKYITPIATKYTSLEATQEIYLLIALQFLVTFYAIPSIVGLFRVKTPATPGFYGGRIDRLPTDVARWMLMSITSFFLATVTKVHFTVRLELAMANTLALLMFIIARFIDARVVEVFAHALGRICCVSLVGYAVIPKFDSSFGNLVRLTTGATIHYVSYVKRMIMNR